MKRIPILLLAAFAALTLAFSDFAEAARMGGGRSFGVTPSKSAPPAATPANNAAAQPTAPAAAPPAGAAPAPSAGSRWLGPIAGIAAGLGLAALLSHFGLSEGFGSLLLVGLLVFAGIFLFRMLMGRRDTAKAPLQYAGVGARDGTRPDSENASAPLWSDAPKVEARATTADGAPVGVTRKPLPQGFDAHGFATEAKRQFVRLQGSYD
ncbi:MAG: Tim44 domain-containing protein, partial [Betaproteobacteria bacterium]